MDVTQYHGHEIEATKWVAHTAYARNGNTHNPTKYYRWRSIVDGRIISMMERTKKGALQLARDWVDTECEE